MHSLRIKAIIGSIFIGLIVSVSVIINIRRELNGWFIFEVEKNAEIAADDISRQIGGLVIDNRQRELESYLTAYFGRRASQLALDIRYIYVADGSGEIIAHTFKESFPLYLKGVNPISAGSPKSVKSVHSEKIDIEKDFAFRINEGREDSLHLGISSREFNKLISAILFRIALVTALCLSIGVVLAVVLANVLVKPIVRLTQTIGELERGNLQSRAGVSTNDEIGRLAQSFNHMVEELEFRSNAEHKIDEILRLSLEDTLFDEFLRRALQIVLKISWLNIEDKGAIYMVEGNSNVLAMRAQYNLSEEILDKCYTIPFGECLCGQAALTRQAQFVNCVDKRHKQYEGITPHGHYCVPIIYADTLLGVINIFLKPSHAITRREEDFFKLVADRLAGVIKRKQAEDALQFAYLELRDAHTRLIQAEKMEAVGRLASGIAHEVKNPLAIILTGMEYLQIMLSDRKDIAFTLDQMLIALRRADNIVRGLLDFSRTSKLELTKERLNSIIYNSLLLLQNKIEQSGIKVETNFTKDDPCVYVDINKIDQVFTNIIMNSIQAMPKGGALFMKTYVKVLDIYGKLAGRRADDTFKLGDKVAVVEIEDTGCGIPMDKIDRLFEPFFTTKREQGGTGLGLSMIKNILDMHGVSVEIKNRDKAQGVKVTVMFKVKEGAVNDA